MTTQAHLAISAPGRGEVPEWTKGDRLRRSLRHADMTVGAMADELQVSLATIGRWLNDRGPMQPTYLRVWAQVTGVDPRWIDPEYASRDSNPEPADLEHFAPHLQLVLGLAA